MSQTSFTRRRFVGIVGASVASLAAADRAFARAMRRLEPGATRSPQSDTDWADVLGAFDLGGRATMNSANLAPASRPARAALDELTRSVDADPSFQNRAQFSEAQRRTRQQVAEFLGVDAEEIALTRNTTESNNFVVQGVELGAGDEVLLTEHNHPSNREAWKVRARRDGFSVVEVPVPSPPPSPQALLDDLRGAVTPRTRLIAYSHVTNLGGCRYPAAEISEMARRRGILTLVDGAQTCGALDVDLRALGCDFYTASGHKWPCAPREVGVLYVRRQVQDRLWPSVVGVGWGEDGAARRFESLGQRDDAAVAAFGHAVRFLQQIGQRRVEERVAALTGHLKRELGTMPRIKPYTPMDAGFSGGVVTFHIDGVDARRAYQWLYEEHRIVAASSGVEEGGVRFSPHIYTSMADCDRALAAVADLAHGRVVL